MVPLRLCCFAFVAIGAWATYEGLVIWLVHGRDPVGAFLVAVGVFFASFLGGLYLYAGAARITSISLDSVGVHLRQRNGTDRVFEFAHPKLRLLLQDRSGWKKQSLMFTGPYSIQIARKNMVTAPVTAAAFTSVKTAIESHGIALQRIESEFDFKPGVQPTVNFYTPEVRG